MPWSELPPLRATQRLDSEVAAPAGCSSRHVSRRVVACYLDTTAKYSTTVPSLRTFTQRSRAEISLSTSTRLSSEMRMENSVRDSRQDNPNGMAKVKSSLGVPCQDKDAEVLPRRTAPAPPQALADNNTCRSSQQPRRAPPTRGNLVHTRGWRRICRQLPSELPSRRVAPSVLAL